MKNISLIGMMGSGKTIIAKELSKLLNNFYRIDIDELIIKQMNKSINEIFKENGELFFRNLETQILKEHIKMTDTIISTGGGIVEREENIKLLKENSVCIYLKTSEETLYSRLKNATDRPLLKSQNDNELKTKIHTLLEKRTQKYENADIIISTDNKTPTEIAKEIIERYKLWTK